MMRLLTTACLVVIGCSAKDGMLVDSSTASGDRSGASEASSGQRNDSEDPERRVRIESLTNDATQSVVRAARFLADQPRFRVVADISFDVMQSDGRLIEFGSTRDIIVRRPDRIRMSATRRDGDVATVYFDGSEISIDLPGHRAYVRKERPGTLYAALAHLSDDLGAPVPLANLLSENFAAPLENQIDAGYYVGDADIGGRRCEHLAFSLPDVDVQMWVEEGDRPLIARIVITHKHENGNPQFRATLHDWDLEVETPDSLFHFEPDAGSERLVVESIPDRELSGGEEAR